MKVSEKISLEEIVREHTKENRSIKELSLLDYRTIVGQETEKFMKVSAYVVGDSELNNMWFLQTLAGFLARIETRLFEKSELAKKEEEECLKKSE